MTINPQQQGRQTAISKKNNVDILFVSPTLKTNKKYINFEEGIQGSLE